MNQRVQQITDALKAKAKQFDASRGRAKEEIRNKIQALKDQINVVESELLRNLESFSDPFSTALTEIESSSGLSSADWDRFDAVAKEPVPPFPIPADSDFLEIKKLTLELTGSTGSKKKEVIPAPNKVIAELKTFDTAEVSWKAVPGARSFWVEMQKAGSCVFSKVFEGNTLKCTVPGLEPETKYVFRVCTVAGKGSVSEWSAVTKVRTPKIPVPANLSAEAKSCNSVCLSWSSVSAELSYKVEVTEASESASASHVEFAGASASYTANRLRPDTKYSFRVQAGNVNSWGEWSNAVVVKTLKEWKWKCCPYVSDVKKQYTVSSVNPRISTKINDGLCTIIGNIPLLLNKVTSWSIKMLNSYDNNGNGIYIGVAPSGIDQNDWNYNSDKYGWYFYCWNSSLCSGPPHNCRGKEYGPRKEKGQYVQTGDSVGVVMDTAKGELSFIVNDVNLGVAFDGIPLDKPLVPCVILGYRGDSVELDTSEVKENLSGFIPFPSNITAKSITCDSITLSWDAVEGASFYQIETDGSKTWDASTTSTFTKRGLLAETEHSFRVRAVCGNEASEWSDAVKGKIQKESFEISVWKECLDGIKEEMKYSVDKMNPRTATKTNDDGLCTIIGNTPLPLNKVSSWNIKILKSKYNDGNGIFIGVAPSDIDLNEDNNYNKCGWYFDCWNSTLFSGPPHNYSFKEYGPRNGDGKYVHTGDSVGVVMDTAKGDLSFVVSGANYGVAFDGIPLDKPLMPCVLLWHEGDSVELI